MRASKAGCFCLKPLMDIASVALSSLVWRIDPQKCPFASGPQESTPLRIGSVAHRLSAESAQGAYLPMEQPLLAWTLTNFDTICVARRDCVVDSGSNNARGSPWGQL